MLSIELWNDFKANLKDCLLATPKDKLLHSWGTNPSRTTLYFEGILPVVASKMNLLFKSEKPLRVDGLFYKIGGQSTQIPIVAIEAENNIKSSDQEIEKLCYLAVPLKILFVCYEWNEATEKEISEGYWEYIIEDFASENILTGTTAIIIADWSNKLTFQSRVYNLKGELVEKENLFQLL